MSNKFSFKFSRSLVHLFACAVARSLAGNFSTIQLSGKSSSHFPYHLVHSPALIPPNAPSSLRINLANRHVPSDRTHTHTQTHALHWCGSPLHSHTQPIVYASVLCVDHCFHARRAHIGSRFRCASLPASSIEIQRMRQIEMNSGGLDGVC